MHKTFIRACSAEVVSGQGKSIIKLNFEDDQYTFYFGKVDSVASVILAKGIGYVALWMFDCLVYNATLVSMDILVITLQIDTSNKLKPQCITLPCLNGGLILAQYLRCTDMGLCTCHLRSQFMIFSILDLKKSYIDEHR